MTAKKQTSADKFWNDESGATIPFSRITALERKKERVAFDVLKKATELSERIKSFKENIASVCDEIFKDHMAESKIRADKYPKGNFTWHNFDRSIRIVVKINDKIEFDDLTIASAKAKIDEFLDRNISSTSDVIKEMVTDAFETRGGKLDTKKVLNLLRYRTKINDTVFQEAMSLLEQSIRRPSSKTYYQVFERLEDGSYELINLDFASV